MYRLYRLAIALVLLSALPAWAQRLQSEVPHDTAIPPASMMVITGCEAKDQDGAALPRAVSAEGDAVRCAATLSGIQYMMIVNEDGSLLLHQVEDAAHVSGHLGIMSLGVQNATHTTALSGTDGDYTPLAVDSTGKLGIRGTYTEDVGHTSADLGLFILCVRNDGGTALAGADLDYIPCTTDASGRLRIAAAPANSGVDIGDVDVTSVIPGTGATNIGKAEDAGHTTGDVGMMVLAVRNDSRGSLAGTDLDYAPLQLNSSGDVRVDGSAVNQPVVGPAADGAAVSGNPVRIAISASGTTQDVFGDSSGRISVIQNEVSSALADGASNTVFAAEGEAGNALVAPAYLFGYNATSWDRIRSGSATSTQPHYGALAIYRTGGVFTFFASATHASTTSLTAQTGLGGFNHLVITWDITVAERDSGNETYDLYIICGDGVSSWDVAHFPQIVSTGAKRYMARISGTILPQQVTTAAPGAASNETATMKTDTSGADQGTRTLAAGVVRHGPLGDRCGADIVIAGTIATGITHSITMTVKP